MENKISKPITMVREELVTSLAFLINDSKLPPFIIEPILKDMYMEVRDIARQQLEMDKRNYAEAVVESRGGESCEPNCIEENVEKVVEK